jgi:hypothetical protein
VTKFIVVTLAIIVATLTMADAGQAQQVATIQGTIQSVDCYTKALTIRTADGSQYRTYVLPPASNSVFVNATPVSFCSLQQYTGSTATVSVVPNGNQLAVTRVDVSTSATPSSSDNQSRPLITGMPDWAKIAVGAVIVGALVYFGSRRHDPPKDPYYQYPYYKCPDGSIRTFCP